MERRRRSVLSEPRLHRGRRDPEQVRIPTGRARTWPRQQRVPALGVRSSRDEHIDVEPVTTLDLDEAVRVVSQSGCIAALVDVYMYGDCAGFTLIEKLRQNPATAELPLIVTSAAHREVGRKVGFLVQNQCSVLLKPFEVDDLIAKVRAVRPARAPVCQIVSAGDIVD